MKVVIAITAEQSAVLTTLIEEHNANEMKYNDTVVKCGDILIHDHGFGFNENQSIKVDNLRVEIEGERCALSTDGILEILAKAISPEVNNSFTIASKLPYLQISQARYGAWMKAKAEFAKLYVVSYETSESRLQWWERLEDIAHTLTIHDLLEMSAEQLGQKSLDGNGQLARIRQLMAKVVHHDYSVKAVAAELDSDEMKVFNRMLDHCRTVYGCSI